MKRITATLAAILVIATLLSACSSPTAPNNDGRRRDGGPNRSGITWQ